MNIFLISLVDTKIKEAMIKFSQLSRVQSAFYYNQNSEPIIHIKKIIDFYISFFKQVGFLPNEYDYYTRKILTEVDIDIGSDTKYATLFRRIVNLLRTKAFSPYSIQDQIFPIHIHYSTKTEIFLVTGIAVIEDENPVIRLALREYVIPRNIIQLTTHNLQYLQSVLEEYNPEQHTSIRELAMYYNKSYNRFQKDCKDYFGDTFYQFYTKVKMTVAIDDILFSKFSLKEIAYKNNFTDYNNMYKVFKKHYTFPLVNIPRFLYEI